MCGSRKYEMGGGGVKWNMRTFAALRLDVNMETDRLGQTHYGRHLGKLMHAIEGFLTCFYQ